MLYTRHVSNQEVREITANDEVVFFLFYFSISYRVNKDEYIIKCPLSASHVYISDTLPELRHTKTIKRPYIDAAKQKPPTN